MPQNITYPKDPEAMYEMVKMHLDAFDERMGRFETSFNQLTRRMDAVDGHGKEIQDWSSRLKGSILILRWVSGGTAAIVIWFLAQGLALSSKVESLSSKAERLSAQIDALPDVIAGKHTPESIESAIVKNRVDLLEDHLKTFDLEGLRAQMGQLLSLQDQVKDEKARLDTQQTQNTESKNDIDKLSRSLASIADQITSVQVRIDQYAEKNKGH